MKLKKTLTTLLCSALTAMALQGEANAKPRAEFSHSIGLRNSDMEKGADKWHEGNLHSNLHMALDLPGDDWTIHGEGDIVAQGVRFGEALKLRTQKAAVLAGKIYQGSDDGQTQVLAGIDERSTVANTGIVDYGWGDASYFFKDVEGHLSSYLTSLAFGSRWINKTKLSENTYQLICTIGSGKADEKIIMFPNRTVYQKNIRFNEASAGGRANLRQLVERDPGHDKPKFFAWIEYVIGLKIIGQSGGYKNAAFEAEFCQLYPLAPSFDMFWGGTLGGTLYGIKPEDITGNGNRRYEWTAGGGFRLGKF